MHTNSKDSTVGGVDPDELDRHIAEIYRGVANEARRDDGDRPVATVGPIGRLGRYTATHFRVVLAAWVLVALTLGFFAPRVENALSGAGWETTGSQSVEARQLIDRNFHGLSSYGLMTVVSSPTKAVGDRAFQSVVLAVQRTLRADRAVAGVVAPARGISISRDGHTAIVQAGA